MLINESSGASDIDFLAINMNGCTPPPLDGEFTPTEVTAMIGKVGLGHGRCFGSKSGYRRANPRSLFIPNANLFSEKHGKVWWGDLDIVKDRKKLELAAKSVGVRLYVLRESDGRFKNAAITFERVWRAATWHTGGLVRVNRDLIARSGLSVNALAKVIPVTRVQLKKPQNPYLALQIDRRLDELVEWVEPIAKKAGFETWGAWASTAQAVLGNRSPLDLVRADEKLNFDLLAPGMDIGFQSGMNVLYPGYIHLGWPGRK